MYPSTSPACFDVRSLLRPADNGDPSSSSAISPAKVDPAGRVGGPVAGSDDCAACSLAGQGDNPPIKQRLGELRL